MLKIFLLLFFTTTFIYSQNTPQKFNDFESDSSMTDSLHFHYLTPDSLEWKNLPKPDVFNFYQDGLKHFPKRDCYQSDKKILVYRPDSSMHYNMPMVFPDSTINYNMPEAEPDNKSPIVVPKKFYEQKKRLE